MALGTGCDQAQATACRLTTSRTDAATSRSMTVYCLNTNSVFADAATSRSMTVIVAQHDSLLSRSMTVYCLAA